MEKLSFPPVPSPEEEPTVPVKKHTLYFLRRAPFSFPAKRETFGGYEKDYFPCVVLLFCFATK